MNANSYFKSNIEKSPTVRDIINKRKECDCNANCVLTWFRTFNCIRTLPFLTTNGSDYRRIIVFWSAFHEGV